MRGFAERRRHMDSTSGQLQCRAGDQVMTSDDHKLGKVVAADTKFVTVEHGLLNKSQYFIPTSAVNTCNGGKVFLNMTKDQIAHSKWDMPPPMETDAGNPPLAL
jgi:hypothetical protein